MKKLKAADDIQYADLKGFLNEIDVMRYVLLRSLEILHTALYSKLRHPNILLLLGACLDYPDICMMCEYIPCGNVHEYLLARPTPWRKKVHMAVDAARGNLQSRH